MTTQDPENPYSAPTVDVSSPAVDYLKGLAWGGAVVAPLSARFGGALVDGVIAAIFNGLATLCPPVAGAVVVAIPFVVQWVLITLRAQTLGKMVAGTQIVRADGERAGFVHGVALRSMPLLVVAFCAGAAVTLLAPNAVSPLAIAGLLTVIDVMWIFGAHHRCLHDLIAGTAVVLVEPGPLTAPVE